MANKIELINELNIQDNRNADDLFDEAVLLCLENNFEQNQNEIIKLFVKSFMTEKNINNLQVCKFKSRDFLLQGYSNESGIFLRNKNLQNSRNVLQDISTIFHELTHIDTDIKNKQKSFINNDIFDYYTDTTGLKIKENLSYALYYLSPNELNSRKNEIVYIKKFIERMEFLMSSFEELKTKDNLNKLNRYNKYLNKFEKRFENKLKKYEKIIKNNQNYLKLHTKKAFDYIKKCDNDEINLKKRKLIKKLNLSIYLVVTYLNVYKDKEFFNNVLKYVQDNQVNSFTYLSGDIVNILNSGCKTFSKKDIDKFLIIFNNENIVSKMNLDKTDLFKHELLYYGDFNINRKREILGQKVSDAFIKNNLKKYKNFKFQGIKYDYCYGKDNKFWYVIKIKGKRYEFATQKGLYLEVSKHINSTWLDNLNEENIKKINSLFEQDLIIDLSKKSVEKKQKRTYEEDKKKDYLFSNVFETDITHTF